MSLLKSTQATARAPATGSRDGVSPAVNIAEFVIPTTAPSLGDIVEMLPIPAGHAVAGLKAVFDQIDSNGAPTLKFDVGVMTGQWLHALDDSGNARTCGTEFGSALTTVGRAAGTVSLDTHDGLFLAASNEDRSLALKFNAASATSVAGAKIRLIGTFVPVPVQMASGS